MKVIRFKKSTVTVNWTLLDDDGQAVDLTHYASRLFYATGAGREEITDYTAGAGGVLTWVFPSSQQKAIGNYSMHALLYDNSGKPKLKASFRDVFRLSDVMYEYEGDVVLNVIAGVVSTDAEPITPGGGVEPWAGDEILIKRVCTEEDFGEEFDEDNINETFNAHAINRLHERLSDAEELLGILQLYRYTVYLWCTNGSMLMRYGAEADIRAEVWRDYDDITEQIPRSFFSWKRSSGNQAADEAWNNAHVSKGPQIHITRADVNGACTFFVEIPVNELINLNI